MLTDPASFPTVDAVRGHLIDQVLITAYPDENQRAHATRWLAWIAHHMGTSRDLPWWESPPGSPDGNCALPAGSRSAPCLGSCSGSPAGSPQGSRPGSSGSHSGS